MRIRLIVPITGLNHQAITQRLEFLDSIKSKETVLDYRQVKNGPPAIESEADAVLAGPDILRLVVEAEEEGVDAAIIWCGDDPALHAARELVDIPVIGPGESMRAISSTLGGKPCRVVPDIPVLEMRKDLDGTINSLKATIRDKVMKGKGDTFYLGCLALFGLGGKLREALGVPILDGAESSLMMAETITKLRLSHSRITYPRKHGAKPLTE
jgi:allantoin racemase